LGWRNQAEAALGRKCGSAKLDFNVGTKKGAKTQKQCRGAACLTLPPGGMFGEGKKGEGGLIVGGGGGKQKGDLNKGKTNRGG